jgi:uncharacterized protein (TIGR00251 family)
MEARIRVRLTPRAARDELTGWRGDLLIARVTAPPVDGKANAKLERLVADALGLPRTAVRLSAGARSREKTLVIHGLAQAEVVARLRNALS